MQAIIGNYAVPILEDRQVWGTSDQTQTAYLDSQVNSGTNMVAVVFLLGRLLTQVFWRITASAATAFRAQ